MSVWVHHTEECLHFYKAPSQKQKRQLACPRSSLRAIVRTIAGVSVSSWYMSRSFKRQKRAKATRATRGGRDSKTRGSILRTNSTHRQAKKRLSTKSRYAPTGASSTVSLALAFHAKTKIKHGKKMGDEKSLVLSRRVEGPRATPLTPIHRLFDTWYSTASARKLNAFQPGTCGTTNRGRLPTMK